MKAFVHLNRVSAATLLSALLCACGGGGGGSGGGASPAGSTTPAPSPSSPLGPRSSLSQTSLSSQADTSGSAPKVFVVATVIEAPTSFYYEYRWAGGAIQSVDRSWTTSSTLQISMNLWPPANLGAGTYSDTLDLRFCEDSECKLPFAEGWKSVAVTYVVTGDGSPNTTFSLNTSSIEVESSAAGVAPSAQVRISVANRPPATLYARFNASALNSASTVDFVPDSNSSATLTIGFKDPTIFPAGIHSDTLVVDICFDRLCARRTKDSPKSVSVAYNVLAMEGRDFSRIVIDGNAMDLAWDPTSQRIFAIIKGSNQFTGNELWKINPTTGIVEGKADVDAQPSMLALSDNGQYAYVVHAVRNSFERAISRFRLDTMTLAGAIHLEMPTNFVNIGGLAVAPGKPETLAILVGNAQFSGVMVYEQGAKKSEWGEALALGTSAKRTLTTVQWGSGGTSVYTHDSISDSLYTLSYTAGTLALSHTQPGLNAGCSVNPKSFCTYNQISFDTGMIKSNFGAIFDTTTQQIVGNYPMGSYLVRPAIAADGARNRDYFYYQDLTSSAVQSFDRAALKPLLTARVTGLDVGANIGEHVSHITRWGQAGLAMNTPTKIIIVSGSFVTP